MPVKNIAYTAEYEQMRIDAMPILQEKYYKNQSVCRLSNGDKICIRRYSKKGELYRLSGSKLLINRDGRTVFCLDMPIDSGRLISRDIINHNNGRQYILFSTELYGYSIMDMESLAVAHFIPDGRLENKESFISTGDAGYCAKNNLMYIPGCYWAYPGSTLIIDFSNPEQLPYFQFDLSEMYPNHCEDIDPIKWNDDGSLLYSARDTQYALSENEIFSLLKPYSYIIE